MKKHLFLINISFIFFNISTLSGQQTNSYSITPMQAGTINLTSKNSMVTLSEDTKQILNDQSLSASYYVVFTPFNGALIPSIADKNNSSFSVMMSKQDKQTSGVTVDYIIFLKRKMVQLSTTKKLINPKLHN